MARLRTYNNRRRNIEAQKSNYAKFWVGVEKDLRKMLGPNYKEVLALGVYDYDWQTRQYVIGDVQCCETI